jgi:tRNA A-37 threonylcarbamoyl transferase component Bud32
MLTHWMDIPPHVVLGSRELVRVAALLGEGESAVRRLENVGICNAIYRVGPNYLLRVPRNDPGRFEDLRRETRTVVKAREVGVRAPVLVRYDDSLGVLPVPYAIYKWCRGVTLESERGQVTGSRSAWSAVGRELATLHTAVLPDAVSWLPMDDAPAAEDLLARRVSEGWLSAFEAEWLGAWLTDLAAAAEAFVPPMTVVVHGDLQAANILVDTPRRKLRAVIDWGDARVGDPVIDFAGMPLRFVPAILEGYREGGADSKGFEPRIVRRHLLLGLHNLSRGPLPAHSWAERPLSFLIELLHFFATAPSAEWRGNAPPSTSRHPI